MIFRILSGGDTSALQIYYDNLSNEDRAWFKPHSFETEEIHLIVKEIGERFEPYIAVDESGRIAAYFFVFKGITENDQRRIAEAGIKLADKRIYSFAPSVSTELRGTGLSRKLFTEVEKQLIRSGGDYLVLQGGVNATNVRAISYYKKIGFQSAGEFERGLESNYAMYKLLSTK